MNYRHSYHAGNFADVLKHAVLARCLVYLKRKDAPFRVIDTHAGTGLYDLQALEARKTGEWQNGIGRVFEDARCAADESLAPYLDAVRAENPKGSLRYYPGSAVLARRLMRPTDRLVANELHPDDHALLARSFAGDASTKVLNLDAWTVIRALLPPKERRGLVLIDPPFEAPDEFARLTEGLGEGLRRFANGIFLLWYPVKDRAAVTDFHRVLAEYAPGRRLSVEMRVGVPRPVGGLTACGLVVVNPPYTLAGELAVLLPHLAATLARDEGTSFALETRAC